MLLNSKSKCREKDRERLYCDRLLGFECKTAFFSQYITWKLFTLGKKHAKSGNGLWELDIH